MARSKLAKMIEDLEETPPQIEEIKEVVVDNTNEIIIALTERIVALETVLFAPKQSINRVEKFNDEIPSTVESYNGMKMEDSDKIQSMQNAIKILPPNMVINGRHIKENIEAICGFKISEEMLDLAYIDIVHD